MTKWTIVDGNWRQVVVPVVIVDGRIVEVVVADATATQKGRAA